MTPVQGVAFRKGVTRAAFLLFNKVVAENDITPADQFISPWPTPRSNEEICQPVAINIADSICAKADKLLGRSAYARYDLVRRQRIDIYVLKVLVRIGAGIVEQEINLACTGIGAEPDILVRSIEILVAIAINVPSKLKLAAMDRHSVV